MTGVVLSLCIRSSCRFRLSLLARTSAGPHRMVQPVTLGKRLGPLLLSVRTISLDTNTQRLERYVGESRLNSTSHLGSRRIDYGGIRLGSSLQLFQRWSEPCGESAARSTRCVITGLRLTYQQTVKKLRVVDDREALDSSLEKLVSADRLSTVPFGT